MHVARARELICFADSRVVHQCSVLPGILIAFATGPVQVVLAHVQQGQD